MERGKMGRGVKEEQEERGREGRTTGGDLKRGRQGRVVERGWVQ